jgi:hypothetical protein
MLRHMRRNDRRGAILIVVLAMLSLFAIVGITFVLVASASAEKQRIQRDAAGIDNGPAIIDNGEQAFARFLNEFIYGTHDNATIDPTGLQSSLRGHDLAGLTYGRYYFGSGGPVQRGANVAWNGVGTFADASSVATVGVDRRLLLNFRQFTGFPIYDPEFASATGRTNPTDPVAGTYIPKNAPYTYPDINNLFLASICPATGEVLVPSFHRQAAFGTLDPNNPNWTNVEGKYLILRPRPQEHPQFPRVPMNADGTYTADVQNLTGGYVYDPNTGRFTAKNDSIWIDIGAPIVNGRDGRRYKMLVAPLILDMDGRLNLSVHGNRMKPITGGTWPDEAEHTSGMGFGPHEVSLQKAFGITFSQEARQLVARRGQARTLAGQSEQKFAARYAAGQHIPGYSQIAWRGFDSLTPGSAVTLPSYPGSPFATSPTYSAGCDCMNMMTASHPVLFAPVEWPAVPGGTPPTQPRTFSLADTKLLSLRHAFAPSFYAGMEVGGFAPNSLRGSFGVPNPNPPGQTTVSNYRLDPAHALRQLVTTLSADLDRPGLSPIANQTAAPSFIGGVDLNRTLADYRMNPALPLLPSNITAPIIAGTSLTQADIDRQTLARDILARLIVANNPTGASVDAAGVITISAAAGTPEHNLLRGLAQLAVNIVDYIDADDVITSFVWNPATAADPYAAANYLSTEVGNRVVFGVEKPRLTLNEAYLEAINDPMDPGVGTMTGPTLPPHIRAWVECQNATSTPYPPPGGTPNSGPLGDGGARLQYLPAEQSSTLPSVVNPYQIQIIRNNKGGWNPGVLRDPTLSASNVRGDLGVAPNLTYSFEQAAASPATRVIPPANGSEVNPNPSKVVAAPTFTPHDPVWPEFAPPATLPWNRINADPFGAPGTPLEFVSDVNLQQSVIGDILSPQHYRYTVVLRRLANPNLQGPTDYNPYITIDIIDHVKCGDRIIRSHMSGTDRSAKMAAGGPGYDPESAPAPGQPDLRPQTVGKVQPYASFSAATTGVLLPFPNSLVQFQAPPDATLTGPEGVRHTFSRQNSIQAVAPPGPAGTYTPAVTTAGSESDATLTDTLMTPYDWLVHLDRPLINPLELMHVTAGKPHELTLQFLVPNTAPIGGGRDVQKSAGTAQWLPVVPPHPFVAPHPNALTPSLLRALDLLRIQPYGHQTALGGRIHGKINLNTIQDKRIWDALFDAQNGNGFTQAEVDQMWADLMATRTRAMVPKYNAAGTQLTDSSGQVYSTPVPGATIYDANANDIAGVPYDRPFLPLGVATIAGGATGGSTFGTATAFQAGIGLQDTILRADANRQPFITKVAASLTHPYQRFEAARKIMNNTTTVSNVFAVWVTVGFFEVVPGASGEDTWGKEYYFEVPGDMRQKLFAIVDRSQMGTPARFYQAFEANQATPLQQSGMTERPFFTTVEPQIPPLPPITPAAPTGTPTSTLNIAAAAGDTSTVVIYADGVPVTIDPANQINNWLYVGSGANREAVQVTGVSFTAATANTPAFATLTTSALTMPHGPGELVSNMMPCNPGPQNFQLPLNSQSQFAPVVPHWSRVP